MNQLASIGKSWITRRRTSVKVERSSESCDHDYKNERHYRRESVSGLITGLLFTLFYCAEEYLAHCTENKTNKIALNKLTL